jgi:hypothetical protein
LELEQTKALYDVYNPHSSLKGLELIISILSNNFIPSFTLSKYVVQTPTLYNQLHLYIYFIYAFLSSQITMWKSVISGSQQAVRTAQRVTAKPSLWTPSAASAPIRTFSAIPKLQKESATQENDWDRESLNPRRSEVSKSGTDDEIAQHGAAFDPNNTAPESELKATEQEAKSKGDGGTLNMSPANKDVRDWEGGQEARPARNEDRGVSSAKGSPNKRRSIHVKEDGTHVSYR